MPTSLARERLVALLGESARRRIAIVGDAMLDIYLRGEVERISPEAPVPVVRVRERTLALGGAANVAQNVAAFGARCVLVAAVGRDSPAERIRQMLAGMGADDGALVEVDRPTTTKTRILARGQQVVRFDEEEDADLVGEELAGLLALVEASLDDADALILEDYNKGVLTPAVIERSIAIALRRGIPVIVDPKYRNFFHYRGATIFKPNRRELESALGAAVDLDHPEALPATLARLGVAHLLLTLGERGMVLVGREGEVHRVPTTARDVYDVVGAGDTVTAYLAGMMAAGASATEAAIIANFAAGVEVGKLGAATVSAAEVIAAHDHFSGSRS
ncbi:MAG: PfkB family carbohydrate kinase [Gemmatimonadota bacterium]|nr:PfkB family carbohydrate kinase [Gemmatimonadota bacterium]MDQ6888485.1 PfkB family carbohydrate kinase [Gemmatimonadota bacterium]